MLKFNLFQGFRWSDKEKNFDDRYAKPNKRKNQHILFFKGKWCVHSEGETTVRNFPDKESAVKDARAIAEEQSTQAFLHNEDGSIETAWVYAVDAFPQEKLHRPGDYPVEEHPGDKVL